MKKHIHAYFIGRVQGVGFRYTVRDIATDLGIAGWVRNLSDGRVEMEAEAEEDILREFLAKIDRYFSGYIRDTNIEWSDSVGQYHNFRILF
ncbi:MAG: acylphosphatase [Candidatus Omnitrophica bacterium]|nr:acylphosphatase [Candidatus Omnitrophota bacterium]